jgi:hypothetical protein
MNASATPSGACMDMTVHTIIIEDDEEISPEYDMNQLKAFQKTHEQRTTPFETT